MCGNKTYLPYVDPDLLRNFYGITVSYYDLKKKTRRFENYSYRLSPDN